MRLLLGTMAIMAGLAAQPALAADTVRWGAQLGAQYSLRLALEQVQAKYDLKFEFKDFRSGTDNILALEQREVDVSTATSQHLLRAIEENMPIAWVIGWGGGYNTLLARADMPVAKGDYAGLKKYAAEQAAAGKKLRIAAPTGSMQHLLLLTALTDAGINPDKDVEVLNVPFQNHPRALEGNEVQMAAGLGLFGAMAITSGQSKLFDHLYGGKWGKQEVGFFVHKKAAEEKPDFIQRIVAAHVEAIGMVMDPVKRVEMEAKGSKLPPPVLEMTEKDFLRVDYRTDLADVATMAKRMSALGWTKRDLSGEIEKNVDFRFLEKATGKSKAELSKW